MPNLWGNLKDGILGSYDEVCGKMRGGEVKEMHGGGMKRLCRQYQDRKMHTRRCNGTLLRRIR